MKIDIIILWSAFFVLFVLCPGLWVVAIVQVLWKGRGPTDHARKVRSIATKRCVWSLVASLLCLPLSFLYEHFVLYFFNALLALVAMAYIVEWHVIPNEQSAEYSCGECGFDLRGLPDDAVRCPECGAAIGASDNTTRDPSFLI